MRSRSFIVRLLASFVLASAAAADAPLRASCGAASCFVATGTHEGLLEPGRVVVDLSFAYVPQTRKLRGTASTGEVLVPAIEIETGEIEPDHHREISTRNVTAEAAVRVGLSPRVDLSIALPLLVLREHEHVDGIGSGSEHFTNDDGATGIGDARLVARYALVSRPEDLLLIGGGVKLPTGPSELRNHHGEINEPTLQPGTGATDLLVSLRYLHQPVSGRWQAFLSGSWQRRGESDLDYRFGNLALVDAGVRFLPSSRLALSLQLNAQASPHDTFRRRIVPSTGLRQVSLTPGVIVRHPSGSAFYAHLQMPVYQDVNEAQLGQGAGLVTGVSLAF
jgi:hypothetical protein